MRLGSKESEHLAKSILLEESGSSLVIRSVIWFSVVIIGLFLGWAYLTQIDEVAIAEGQTVPTGQVQKVQHVSGGIIAEILVKEGQAVSKGMHVMRLDSLAARSELQQTKAQLRLLNDAKRRLEAFASDGIPDYSTLENSGGESARQQLRIFYQSIASQKANRSVLEQQIEQHKADMEELTFKKKAFQKQISLIKKEYKMRNDLLKKGLTPKTVVLAIERRLSEIQGELSQVPSQKKRIEKKISETQSRLNKIDVELRGSVLKEQADAESEIARLEETVKRQSQRLSQKNIKAPVSGFVHGLQAHAIGEVLEAGKTILEIVPVDRALLAEVHVSPKDIGHVYVGQNASLRFTSFDFSRFGDIEGVLEHISPTTYMDEKGHPYYKATISMQKKALGDNGEYQIMPGMPLTANIWTGSKTVMEYLLKPIYSSSQSALRER